MVRVELGSVVVTPAARAALAAADLPSEQLLARFAAGDWGDAGPYRRSYAEFAARNALPVISRYRLGSAEVVVITGGDRAETRISLEAELAAVEVSLEDGYALWSRTYDVELNQLIVVEQAYIDELLDRLRCSDALDAATGTGRHAFALARRGMRVAAFDTSKAMLTVARERACAENLAVGFCRASLLGTLPFRDASFDLVLCGLVFCHLPDIATPCREFYRVLRPGGQLVLTDFHPEALPFGWRTEMWQGTQQYRLPNVAHTRAAYLEAVRQAGFRLCDVRDFTIADIPAHVSHAGLQERYGAMKFCLAIHAEKA